MHAGSAVRQQGAEGGVQIALPNLYLRRCSRAMGLAAKVVGAGQDPGQWRSGQLVRPR